MGDKSVRRLDEFQQDIPVSYQQRRTNCPVSYIPLVLARIGSTSPITKSRNWRYLG